MKKRRIISIGRTNIYHKPGCGYEKRILSKNRMEMSKEQAQVQGYCACQYCNSMNYQYKKENEIIKQFAEQKDMEFKYADGLLYVKTINSLWKLVYSMKEEKIALYHRNSSDSPVDMNNLEIEKFHRQKDILYMNTIHGCLNYIYEHDKYRRAVENGEKNIHYSSKKYEQKAKKSERRKVSTA